MGNIFISRSCWWANTGTQGKKISSLPSPIVRKSLLECTRILQWNWYLRNLSGGKRLIMFLLWNMRLFSFSSAERHLKSYVHYSLQFSLPLFLLSCEPSPCIYKISTWYFICEIWSNNLERLLTLHIYQDSSKRGICFTCSLLTWARIFV